DDAEILFAGKEQSLAATQMIADDLVRLPAEEMDVWSGLFAQTALVLAGADNHQRSIQASAGGNGQIEPFVRGERRHGQVEVLSRHRGGAIKLRIDRRIDDRARSLIAFVDAGLDRTADGNEMTDRRSGAPVPVAQQSEEALRRRGLEASESAGTEIGFAQVPGI